MTALPRTADAIERACRATRQFSGPGPYNECVTRKVRELERSPLPDLSALSSFDRKAIKRVCWVDVQFNGPGAYNTCLARKRVELERNSPHDLSSFFWSLLRNGLAANLHSSKMAVHV